MALASQTIPVRFSKLDSKTDPRHVIPGDLVALQNVDLAAWPKLKKRPGSLPLATTSAGSQLAPWKGSLLIGTGSEAYSLTSSGALIDRGVLESMTLTALSIARNTYPKQTVDCAVHPAGVTAYTFESIESGSTVARYSVFDTATGQPIVANVALPSTASRPKPFALGNFVVIIHFDSAANHLKYVAIPAANPTSPGVATDLATDPQSSTVVFDGAVIGGGRLFIAYMNTSGKIGVTYLTSGLILGSETQTVTVAATTLACFGDGAFNVWLAYSTASAVAVTAYSFDLSMQLFAPATVNGSPGTVRNITGIAPAGTATLFYEVTGSQTYNNLIRTAAVSWGAAPPTLSSATPSSSGGTLATGTYYYVVTALGTSGETLRSGELSAAVTGPSGSVALAWTAVTGATGYRVYRGTTAGGENVYYAPGNVTTYTDSNASSTSGSPPSTNTFGAVSGDAVYARSVGLASKPFYYLSRTHVLAAYQSTLQSTYFLLSGSSARVVGKLAPSLGGGLTVRSMLSEVCAQSAGVYRTSYLQTDEIGVQSGQVFSQAGVQAAAFDFTQPQCEVELSDDLHLSGGILSMYDGAAVVEHGFNLYPENITSSVSGTGLTGQYQYVVTYEWMDAQGLLHQSAPSPAITLNPSNQGYQLTIPTLRLTAKSTPIAVVVWRTQANGTIFYRLNSISSPLLNTTSADTVTYTDNASDSSIAGNAQLYSNPDNTLSELPNLAAPAPLYVWRYRNRISMIPAENAYQWTFSKAFVPGVPVEFNALNLFQGVAQDGGPLTCGIEMDEKNVLFSASRIYAVVGDGPAPNGTGSDYGSAPQAIPSDVGCSNARSLALTPQGVMFQASNGKGIYLLTRGLQMQYVGAPIEAWNGYTVTAAVLAPDNRRVIFETSAGVALVYDYYTSGVLGAPVWIVYTGQSAADATVYGGRVAQIQAGGTVLQEAPGVWTDNGNPILIGLTTSWLAFAGINGFQRVWRFSLRGDYRSAHKLLVSVAYDDSPAALQVETVDAAAVLGPGPIADTTTGGTDNPGDGAYPAMEWMVKLLRQKCSSIQITIQESQAGPTYGEGLSLSGITFLAGIAGKLHPVPKARAI